MGESRFISETVHATRKLSGRAHLINLASRRFAVAESPNPDRAEGYMQATETRFTTGMFSFSELLEGKGKKCDTADIHFLLCG